jgi:type IV pilus assembly protein PilN
MIKVNLLPPEEQQKRVFLKILAILLGGVIIIVAGGVGYFSYLSLTELSLKRELRQLKKELEEYKDIARKLEEIKKKRNLLQKRLQIIENFKKYQTWWPEILAELSRQIPDGVWLDGFQSEGTTANISGYSFTYKAISHFLKNLEEVEFFDKVELLSTQQEKTDEEKIIGFKIVFNLKS